MEVYEIHHNTFNNFEKNNNVSRDEFVEFYRTLNPSYEDDKTFIAMVKGVWGVKNITPDVSQRGWAGGREDAANARERYIKSTVHKPAPFGTSNQDDSN